MRKLIIATAALALLSSTALAQDKAGGTAAPAAQGTDTMSKGDMTKTTKKKTKSKKSAKKTSGEMQKQ